MQSLLCVCFISENQPVLPWNLPNHTELLRYSFFKPATGTVYSKAILNVQHKLIKSKFSWVLTCRLMQIKSHTLCRCRRPQSVHIQTDRFNLCQNNVLFFSLCFLQAEEREEAGPEMKMIKREQEEDHLDRAHCLTFWNPKWVFSPLMVGYIPSCGIVYFFSF